jgi:hypothetical protein
MEARGERLTLPVPVRNRLVSPRASTLRFPIMCSRGQRRIITTCPPRCPLHPIIGSGLRSASRGGVVRPAGAVVLAVMNAPRDCHPTAPPPWLERSCCLWWMPGGGLVARAGQARHIAPTHHGALAPGVASLPRRSLAPPKKNVPFLAAREMLPVQIFSAGFARVDFRPNPRQPASHLYPCNYPCKFRVISRHFRAFLEGSG